MTDFVTWIGDILAMDLATIGTVDVTLGLVVAFVLVAGAAIGIAKRLKGR